MSAPETLKGLKPATTIAVQASQIEMLEQRCADLVETKNVLYRQIEAMDKSARLMCDKAAKMDEQIERLTHELDAARQSASRLQGYIDRVREKEAPLMNDPGHKDWAPYHNSDVRNR